MEIVTSWQHNLGMLAKVWLNRGLCLFSLFFKTRKQRQLFNARIERSFLLAGAKSSR